jgi:hypothetical protein
MDELYTFTIAVILPTQWQSHYLARCGLGFDFSMEPGGMVDHKFYC